PSHIPPLHFDVDLFEQTLDLLAPLAPRLVTLRLLMPSLFGIDPANATKTRLLSRFTQICSTSRRLKNLAFDCNYSKIGHLIPSFLAYFPELEQIHLNSGDSAATIWKLLTMESHWPTLKRIVLLKAVVFDSAYA